MFKNIKTAEDLQAEELAAEKAQKVTEARAYLNSTGWIIEKISERSFVGEDIEPLKTKYIEELTAREEARALINLHE